MKRTEGSSRTKNQISEEKKIVFLLLKNKNNITAVVISNMKYYF